MSLMNSRPGCQGQSIWRGQAIWVSAIKQAGSGGFMFNRRSLTGKASASARPKHNPVRNQSSRVSAIKSAGSDGFMFNQRSWRSGQSGLTLLEVILAISATAVILIILLSALRLGQRSQLKGIERQEVAQRTRILTDRMAWLLAGAYPYSRLSEQREVEVYFNGSSQSIGFVTTSVDKFSSDVENLPGLVWVSVHRDDDGLWMLERVFYDEGLMDEEPEGGQLFAEAVTKLEFSYLDRTPEGADFWVPSWSTAGREYIPYAVRVSMSVMYKGDELKLPDVVSVLRAGGRTPE